jgi:hypothetical protein
LFNTNHVHEISVLCLRVQRCFHCCGESPSGPVTGRSPGCALSPCSLIAPEILSERFIKVSQWRPLPVRSSVQSCCPQWESGCTPIHVACRCAHTLSTVSHGSICVFICASAV